MGEDEAATVRTITAYRELMTSLIQQHRGRVVDSPGDNLLAGFASVVEAVQCAMAIQRELKTRNAELPPQRRMGFVLASTWEMSSSRASVSTAMGSILRRGWRAWLRQVASASR